jgi:SAM-dependent methyltransferase/methyltransferase-like protein
MITPYDQVIYPNQCHSQTHPDRLAVIGELFGMRPAAPQQCRMLELGCGDGTNLLPLAYCFPDSRFVGVDLAPTMIAEGQKAIASLGLKNVELHCLDIASFPRIGENFDYVVAHGIYSWVTPEVREALLAICSARLKEQGIAYVSYNCFPGGHIRRMAREIMRFHVRGETEPQKRLEQAVAVTRFIANSLEKPDAYRKVFHEQLEQIQRYGPGYLFHDDLAEINDPVYFVEFMSKAARHKLQYLSEADFFEMQEHTFSAEARQALGVMMESRVTFEQYLDFVKCRRFRQTLLCHSTEQLSIPRPEVVQGFYISSDARPEDNGEKNGKVVRFRTPRGGALSLDHPGAKAALSFLTQCWPGTVSFDELCKTAVESMTSADEASQETRQTLADIFLEAFRAGVVTFRKTPVRCATTVSEHPTVWAYARSQIQRRDSVTTLRGDNIRIGDEHGKRLLQLLDGSRGIPELKLALGSDHPEQNDNTAERQFNDRLKDLVRLALLEA